MSFRIQSSHYKFEVVVVTPSFTSPEGGAGQVANELITIISRRAPFHFTWVAQEGVTPAKPATPEVPGQTPAPYTPLPMRGKNFLKKALGTRYPPWDQRSLQALRQAIGNAHLVWIHDTLYPGAHAAFRIARALGRPVLATQHESPAFYAAHGNRLRRARIHLTDRLITSSLLRQAQQVIFTSNAAARFYHRRISFRNPAKIIPNGVQNQIFRPPSAEDYRALRTRFALRDDQPVLLFVGRFEKASGLLVIRAMARLLPKWRFWIAGHGRIKPESWYLPNVQVFKDRAGDALAELYQAADLLVLPGCDPDSPYVLQQALACQLPVMCSPAVVAGHAGAARCLVVNTDKNSYERTAKIWVQKLKAGRDIWPAAPEGEPPFDSSWDWLQAASHYTAILQDLCRAEFKH